jgi:hypothetical protein
MDKFCKLLIAGMVRSSERPKNDFQKRLLLDFIAENIQLRPAYKLITTEEIKIEIERCLNGTVEK